MPNAGCLCNNLRVTYDVEPKGNVLCHCLDCRKISGSAFSVNHLIPEDHFKVATGTPKTYTKTADSGNPMTSYFCGDCGSTVWRETPKFAGLKILKAGTLDDPSLMEPTAGLELFTRSRPGWVHPIPGADQSET